MKLSLSKLFKNRNRVAFFYLLIIIFLSLYPRLWQLKKSPPMIVDEPANLREINQILETNVFNITSFHWDFSKSHLVYAPTLALTKILGPQNSFFALRLTSVIFSLLALIPFFYLVRGQTNKEIAFVSTLLFSFSYYFLQFSRVGWINIIFVTSAGLYLFWLLQVALKRTNPFLIGLAGILAGIIFYSYRGGIIYLFASAIYLFFTLVTKKTSSKKTFTLLGLFGIAFLITASPWIAKISGNLDEYNLRARVVAVSNTNLPYRGFTDFTNIYKYQVETALKSWVLLSAVEGGGEENPRYLPLSIPPVNNLIRFTFWAGLVISFLKLKNNYQWLIIFLSAIIFGQILTVYPPNGARGLIMLPVIYLFSSLALFEFYKKSDKSKVFLLLMLTASLLMSYLDFKYYQYWMIWIPV